uniref:Protodermal factor 1.1 n=1 Tax=Gossypium raimondii TaxID=29730 RepID=A0A0D2RXG1_GOSRA|nr:hypothetical protein B456_012G041900 [Gossypium raimondii]
MERQRSKQVCLLMWVLVAALFSHNMVIAVTSTGLGEQKNYYPAPDPHAGTPPSGSHGTPPSSGGGSPPSHGTPSHGGGYHPSPTPSTPSGGNCGSPPSYGGGSPPTTPIDPGTPSIPSPPFFPAPTPPIGGTCDFWRSHPTLIWGLLGWWGSVGNAFGVTNAPGLGTSMSLPQALSNTRTDGLGALYREGTASFLNSMVNNRFPFSTKQVRETFVAALGSNSAAAAQARLFKLANEGHLKPRT